MTKITLQPIERVYKNNGQQAEITMRFTLTGEIGKADNKPHWMSGDVLDIQVKSQKATVCKGYDLKAYLDRDAARKYAYVSADFTTAYLMSREEWEEFCGQFTTKSRESARNGGGEKLQLLTESRRMKEYLNEKAN
jgi:hypothetical protein